MSILYVNENGASIGIKSNRIVVLSKDKSFRSIPLETLDGITILGKSQLTTDCMETCLKKGIPVAFFSKGGRFFGRLISTGHVKAALQRKQGELYDKDFSLGLSKKIVAAKIRNQLVLLKRYAKNEAVDIQTEEKSIKALFGKIVLANSISELMGYEGNVARMYFKGLSKCINQDFAFKGRNRRPPRDPFNSMISLGYSILLNEIYSEIEQKGLNPYFGFLHRDAENHPTLASDLMEEWRAILVDATVMSLINGNEISLDEFEIDYENGGCYISKEGLNIFLRKFEKKLQTKIKYLKYVDYSVSFRQAIALQTSHLVKAVEAEDYNIYEPIVIR
ncbi:MAG: CRISPR-associated endonuclease Cas1 [Anaerovoracaceae bacterium]